MAAIDFTLLIVLAVIVSHLLPFLTLAPADRCSAKQSDWPHGHTDADNLRYPHLHVMRK
jgi:hypothetical protein